MTSTNDTVTSTNDTETNTDTEADAAPQTQPILTAPLGALVLEHRFWANPRTILDDEKLAELQTSIKDKGILVPLHVARVLANGETIYLVLDGQRRVMAGGRVLPKDYQVPIVDVWPEVIEDLTWEISDQLLTIALDIGNRREALTSYELVETAERLKNRGKTQAAIGRALNRHPTWVSKFLAARLSATPKLMARWRRGEVSDEMFKDLAMEKDGEKQDAATKEVVDARKNDKGEARMRAKELAATNKRAATATKEKSADKPAKTSNGVKATVVNGPQQDLPVAPPPKKSMVSRLVLEDLMEIAARRPAVHDYVRGLFDAVAYILGDKTPAEFARPWHQYLARIDGKTPPKSKRAVKARRKARGK